MKTTQRIIILLILGLLAVGLGQSAEEPTERISNTRTANCLVKITCDSAILPPDLRAIDYLLHSSGVGGKACREVLGIVPDQNYDLFTVEYVQSFASDDLSGISLPTTPPARMARRPGETTAQYEARLRAEAAAKARALPTTRSRTTTTSAIPDVERTLLYALNINLPEEVKPAAKEFMSAIVENLRHVLFDAYDTHVNELQSSFHFVERQRDLAQKQLAEVTGQIAVVKVTPPIEPSPADAAVQERLEQIVDLPNLTQGTPFAEAIKQLANSVDPPLQIQPNWKDLLEMAEIEPTTPCMMDPLAGVKLRKALDLLLAGVSSGIYPLNYVVDEGVVVIATQENLTRKMVSRVYEIPALAQSAGGAAGLVQAIQESIEPDSWLELGAIGEGTISVYMGNKLAIRQTDDSHRKIYEFLQSVTTNVPVSMPLETPVEMIISEKRDLLHEKQNIEMEIARLRARQSAIETQILRTETQIAEKLHADPVTAELQQLVEIHNKILAATEGKLAPNHPARDSEVFAEVKEKLARAKIELAQRQEQLSNAVGGDQIARYNNELADMTIELAEKTAALQLLDKQLGRTEQQFMAATMLDPHLSRIRSATRSFEIADQRVNELNIRAANLQPPTVSILGAD